MEKLVIHVSQQKFWFGRFLKTTNISWNYPLSPMAINGGREECLMSSHFIVQEGFLSIFLLLLFCFRLIIVEPMGLINFGKFFLRNSSLKKRETVNSFSVLI